MTTNMNEKFCAEFTAKVEAAAKKLVEEAATLERWASYPSFAARSTVMLANAATKRELARDMLTVVRS